MHSKPQVAQSRADRAELRRNQVIEAAKRRFREVGFHSTSMAEIAHEAHMSVGHIYRYFPSKESLIEGIVHQDLERQLEGFTEILDENPDDILAALASGSERCAELLLDNERTALMLEVAAEAVRNPKIRAFADVNQHQLKMLLRERLQRARPADWSEAEMDARLQLVSALFQGLAMQLALSRQTANPALLALLGETAKGLMTSKEGPAPAEGGSGRLGPHA